VAVIILLRTNHLLTGLVLGGLIAVVGSVLGAVARRCPPGPAFTEAALRLCTGYVEPRPGAPVKPSRNGSATKSTRSPGIRGEAADVRDLRRAGVTLKMLEHAASPWVSHIPFPLDRNDFTFPPKKMRSPTFPSPLSTGLVAHANGKKNRQRIAEPVDTSGFRTLAASDDLR